MTSLGYIYPVKGIVLAGGNGTRLFPLTKGLTKSLLPVYDKPMFYYPLSTLMLMGIKEILIISTEAMLPLFKAHFGDGEILGISIEYAAQHEPKGIPDAFRIAEKFIKKDQVTLILGDNLLYGTGLGRELKLSNQELGATLTLYKVADPSLYGVATLDENGEIITNLSEKPTEYVSSWAIPGIYRFDNSVIDKSRKLKPSKRGELEIIDLLDMYLDSNSLSHIKLERGTAWLDMGNHEALLEASNFIRTIQERQGLQIGNPFEVAWRNNWISKKDFIGNSNISVSNLDMII